MTNWTGFYKKSMADRHQILASLPQLDAADVAQLSNNQLLGPNLADQLVENVIGTFSLPLALVPEVLLDGKTYQVPYVTEEPSVVAAASFASKLIGRSGGFTTDVHQRLMIGQVALYGLPDFLAASQVILAHKPKLLELANAAHPSIVKRGGGARDLYLDQVAGEEEDFLVVYLKVDTQEAMGANMVNTMLEALIPHLEEMTGGQSLMAILSNYATESLVTARCALDIRHLSPDPKEASRLAKKLTLASQLAQADPYRASTHNKGIFNGIDALVLATGNDWRAIQAGAHTYASRDGHYRGLSQWQLSPDGQQVLGELTLPMPIATKGGSIGLNPTVQLAHKLLGNPSAKELSRLVVAMGLAQNLAALKALTSTGIQAGHMKLHAKSLALLAGAQPEKVPQVVTALKAVPHLNLATAQEILNTIRQTKKD